MKTIIKCHLNKLLLQLVDYKTLKSLFVIPVEALTDLYIEGEETYTIEEGDKLTSVVVDRFKFVLSDEARSNFETIHDEWEMRVCQKYPNDALVGG